MRPTYVLNNLTSKIPTHSTVRARQQNSLHKTSTAPILQTSSQRKNSHFKHRPLTVPPTPSNFSTTVLSCKGVLKPTTPNPRRLGINRDLIPQLSTRTCIDDDSPSPCSPSKPDHSQSWCYTSSNHRCQQLYILNNTAGHQLHY